jgi:hypothetical protein
MTKKALEDQNVNVRIKLALLWSSIVFCFVYGDYFELYEPNKLASMLDGRIGPLGEVTEGKLLGTSIMMAIPSLMVALAVVLKPVFCKWINIFCAILFLSITVLVIQGAWNFYVFFGVVEMLLLLSVAWQAWSWPRMEI